MVASAAVVDVMKSEVLLDAAIKESWSLVDKGQKLADQGKTASEIIKILPTGTLVSVNSSSILFYIESSTPMIIELDKKKKIQTKGSAAKETITSNINTTQSLATFPLNTPISADDKLVDVMGSERGDDEREAKKALILAPYNKTDFKGNDDADVAYKYLNENRNYKGNILFRKENITLDDFTSFDDYDLVHLSTHGLNHCVVKKIDIAGGYDIELIDVPIGECITSIATGIKHGFDDIRDEAQIAEYKKKYEKYGGAILLSKTKIYLKPLFFDYFYKKGITNGVEINGDLKDKIWIFSACQLGQNGMTRLVMEGVLEDSHFFYWENSVGIKDAKIAYDSFYNNLIVKGLNATKSFEEIPIHLKKDLPLSMANYTDIDSTLVFYEKTTSLEHINTGDPRHGIEVIDMLNPTDNSLVQTGDFYELVGDFNDGKDEALTLKVKLIGYTKEEFLEKQMSLSLFVDDENALSNHMFLPDNSGDNTTVASIKEHEYGVIVTITDIAIPDVGTKEALTLKAILHLNDVNISIHKETVSIVDKGIIAHMSGDGFNAKYIYDNKTKAAKMESKAATIYNDNEGFTYFYNKKYGSWQKINVAQARMMGMAMSPFPGFDEKQYGEFEESQKIPPVIAFAINFSVGSFESRNEFRKSTIVYKSIEGCRKFIEPQGFTTIFSPTGKLLELTFGGKVKIQYEYGDYEVNLPQATEISSIMEYMKAESSRK